MKQIDDIITLLKQKYPNIKTKDIEEIVRHQFEYLKEQIKNNRLPSVKLPYLGKFYVKEGTRERRREKAIKEGLMTDEEDLMYRDV